MTRRDGATLRTRHFQATAGLVILAVAISVSALAEHVLPHTVDEIDLRRRSLEPTLAGGHLFGTDALGRDHFTRVVVGVRSSAVVALTVATLSTFIGVCVGAAAGYFGGLADKVLMRLTDAMLTVPALVAVLAVAGLSARRSPLVVGLVIGTLAWPLLARLVRARVASLRRSELVEGARALGASNVRIIVRTVLPHTVGIVVVHATIAVPAAILLEASVSFLGFGVQPPMPSLGSLIAEGRSAMLTDWWLVTFPGLAIVVLCLAVNLVGEVLRRAFDPPRS